MRCWQVAFKRSLAVAVLRQVAKGGALGIWSLQAVQTALQVVARHLACEALRLKGSPVPAHPLPNLGPTCTAGTAGEQPPGPAPSDEVSEPRGVETMSTPRDRAARAPPCEVPVQATCAAPRLRTRDDNGCAAQDEGVVPTTCHVRSELLQQGLGAQEGERRQVDDSKGRHATARLDTAATRDDDTLRSTCSLQYRCSEQDTSPRKDTCGRQYATAVPQDGPSASCEEADWTAVARGGVHVPAVLLAKVVQAVADMAATNCQDSIEGCCNLWIIKPAGRSRGRGIFCSNSFNEVCMLSPLTGCFRV